MVDMPMLSKYSQENFENTTAPESCNSLAFTFKPEELIQENRSFKTEKPIPNVIIAKRPSFPTFGTNCTCVCGLKFSKIAILIEHVKVCKVPYKWLFCRICNMLCSDRRALAVHQIQAHGSKPCVDCGRKFTSSKILQRHRVTRHTNLECRICGKKYKTNKSYIRHVRYHTQPFWCLKCNLRYSSSSGLKDHIISTHDGLKFNCKECTMSYTHRSNLRAHVLEKHKFLRYFCSCGSSKGYTRKNTIERHMLRVHGGIIEWEYKETVA